MAFSVRIYVLSPGALGYSAVCLADHIYGLLRQLNNICKDLNWTLFNFVKDCSQKCELNIETLTGSAWCHNTKVVTLEHHQMKALHLPHCRRQCTPLHQLALFCSVSAEYTGAKFEPDLKCNLQFSGIFSITSDLYQAAPFWLRSCSCWEIYCGKRCPGTECLKNICSADWRNNRNSGNEADLKVKASVWFLLHLLATCLETPRTCLCLHSTGPPSFSSAHVWR